MKKQYSLPILVFSIILILTQVASFTLQHFFGTSGLSLSFRFDIFVILAISFIMILQFKSHDKVVAIIATVYGALNLVYSITVVSYYGSSTGLEQILGVLFLLFTLLAYSLFEISALFLLIHSIKPKFETKVTKTFVGICLSISLLLIIGAGIVNLDWSGDLPVDFAGSIVTLIFAYLAIAAFYATLFFFVQDKPQAVQPEVIRTSSGAVDELDNLHRRGIITDEEYAIRKSKLQAK